MRKRALGLTVLLLACSAEQLDVGDDPANRGGNGGASPAGGTSGATPSSAPSEPLPVWTSQGECQTDPEFADLLGTWQGQLENFQLEPVKTVRMVLNGVSAHGVCGSITYGDGPPLAPATDPDGLFPAAGFWTELLPTASNQPVDGFTYTIDGGAIRDQTLHLSTQKLEPWRSWCELQQSYPSSHGWLCMPDFGGPGTFSSDPNGVCEAEGQTYTSFKCFACGFTFTPLCTCNAEACTAGHGNPNQIALTLSDDATLLTGPVEDADLSFYLKHLD